MVVVRWTWHNCRSASMPLSEAPGLRISREWTTFQTVPRTATIRPCHLRLPPRAAIQSVPAYARFVSAPSQDERRGFRVRMRFLPDRCARTRLGRSRVEHPKVCRAVAVTDAHPCRPRSARDRRTTDGAVPGLPEVSDGLDRSSCPYLGPVQQASPAVPPFQSSAARQWSSHVPARHSPPYASRIAETRRRTGQHSLPGPWSCREARPNEPATHRRPPELRSRAPIRQGRREPRQPAVPVD